MWIIWTILGVVVLVLVCVHLSARGSQKAFFKVVFAKPEFACAKYYITNDGARGIAVDAKRRQICLWRHGTAKVFPYHQIETTQIIVNGSPKSGGSGKAKVLAGRAVGTALGGFAGGMIGAAMANTDKPHDRRIHNINLKVTCLDDSSELGVVIPFLSSPAEYGDKSYETSKERIKEWHELLSLIVEENKEAAPNRPITSTASPAMIRFQCDRCSKRFKVAESFAGKLAKCSGCGNKIEIPRDQGPTPPGGSGVTTLCSYCHHPLEPQKRPSQGTGFCSVCNILNAPGSEDEVYPEYKGEARRRVLLIGLPVILAIGLISYGIAIYASGNAGKSSADSGPQETNALRSTEESFADSGLAPRVAALTRPYADSQSEYFKCQYPSSWQVRELDDAQNRRVQFMSSEGNVEFRVRIPHATATRPVDDESLMQMFAQQGRSLIPADRGEWIDDQQLRVAGLPAYEMEYRQRQPTAHCRVVFLLSGQRMHVVMLAAQDEDRYAEYSRMFDQFLYSYDPAR